MKEFFKYRLRALQTRVPFLQDLRFDLQFGLRRLKRQTHDPDFDLLRFYEPNPKRVLLDIGSNRGEAIESMLIAHPGKCTVVGFEPNPLVFDKLQRRHGSREEVVLHECGLADMPSQFFLFIPFYRKWMFDGLASFKKEAAADWLVNRLWKFKERHLSIRKEICILRKLDDFKLAPDFVKIDVQGYEMQVLKGGAETLALHRPILLIESIQPEHVEFLRQFGYRFYGFDKGRLIEGKGRLNTFCITDYRLTELHIEMVQRSPAELVY